MQCHYCGARLREDGTCVYAAIRIGRPVAVAEREKWEGGEEDEELRP